MKKSTGIEAATEKAAATETTKSYKSKETLNRKQMYWSWSTTSILTRIISSKETSQSERKTEAPCQRKTYIYCLRLSRSNLAHRKMHGRIWYCLVGCMQGSVRGSLNLLRDSSENDLIYMSHYNAIVLDSWPWLACWIYYNLIKSWTKLSIIILIQCYPLLYIFLENYCSLLAFVFVSPPLGFFYCFKTLRGAVCFAHSKKLFVSWKFYN